MRSGGGPPRQSSPPTPIGSLGVERASLGHLEALLVESLGSAVLEAGEVALAKSDLLAAPNLVAGVTEIALFAEGRLLV